MKTKFFLLLAPLSLVYGQTSKSDEVLEYAKNNLNVNFLLRSSFESTDKSQEQNAIKLNEARVEFKGKVLEDLGFRVRYRLNKTQTQLSLDKASSSLDIAYIDYKFGEDKKWNLILGKQANDFGSWEFSNNPTFEYAYSDYINRQQNLFTLGARIGYELDSNNTVRFQIFNTTNHTFSELYNQQDYNTTNGLDAAKTPVGLNLTWRGDFFDKSFQTYYSLTTSKVAKNKNNFQIALGNKFKFGQLDIYFDLHHTKMAVDYTNVASSIINQYKMATSTGYEPTFINDVEFQSAVLRVDYPITPKFIFTGKSIYERVNHPSELGKSLRVNSLNLVGLEYKPFATQDFKLFGYFSNSNVSYNSKISEYIPNQNKNTFAIGALYFIKTL